MEIEFADIIKGEVADVNLLLYAVFQFVSSVVVGITYPEVNENTPVELVYVSPVAVELSDVNVMYELESTLPSALRN